MRRHLKQGRSGFYIETESYVLRSTFASRLVPSMTNLVAQNLKVCPFKYYKVENSSMSWLVVHPKIFRQFMKEKFDAYVL